MQAGDIHVCGLGDATGSTALIPRSFLERSPALRALQARLDRAGTFVVREPTKGEGLGGGKPALELQMSPSHTVSFPQSVREALGITQLEDVHFAWVSPLSPELHSGPRGGFPPGEAPPVAREKSAGALEAASDADVEEELLDASDPDVSFLTVGGYVYFRPAPESGLHMQELQLLSAHSIRFSPQGALQFSAPRRWEPAWTQRLVQQDRFKEVTVRAWVAAGARYVCWVRPDEPLPDSKGRVRPLARHGGFAFLFHYLDESDNARRDCYFEVVAAPNPQEVSSGDLAELTRMSSLPFNLTSTPAGHEAKLHDKLFELARGRRWALVRHLLTEYPSFAVTPNRKGETLLHVCADGALLDAEFLALVRSFGAAHDAQDAEGKTPEMRGTAAFRSVLRAVWHLSPDLFEDPEGWFMFWDRDGHGALEPAKLSDALATAYRCDMLGTQWVRSYVNTHHPAGATRAELLGEQGLLRALQASEEFSGLRQQRTPPLFRGGFMQLTASERVHVNTLEDRLERLRARRGWEPGKPAPPGAMLLMLPAPCPEGDAEHDERLETARTILGFSFEQTRGLSGAGWRAGFRVDFNGQQGLDEGGLTKAWVAEIGCALWADTSLFDVYAGGCFFKPDEVETLTVDGAAVAAVDVYRWTGHFVAYALYQRCMLDCRLCLWAFRALHRAALPRHFFQSRSAQPDWALTPEGEDTMLADLSTLDHTVASNMWRVRHEMEAEELRWLDFTYAGSELEPGGAGREVTPATKAAYVRLACTALLRQRCSHGMQAFAEGFFEVVPQRLLENIPGDCVLRELIGEAEVSDDQLAQLESIVVPAGLVPAKLRDHPRVQQAAGWVFRTARESDSAFRTRLLEFWFGTGRVPITGFASVQPRPRLQVMVLPDTHGGVKRIESWPQHRLPEGHTCGNELWVALQDSYEQASVQLRLAVQNYESGFSLR